MSTPQVKVNLTVVEGEEKGRSFNLTGTRATIGRKGTDIRLADKKVSTMHAAIEIEGEQVFVVDLDSRNGIFVNGEKATRAALKHLDEVAVGLTRFRVAIVEDLAQFRMRNLASEEAEKTIGRNIGDMIDDELRRFSKWDLSAPAPQEGEAGPAPSPCWIEVVEGPDAGQKVRLERRRNVLGRGKADIPFQDTDISRRHAEIEVGPNGRATLRDLGSTNGTFVNSNPVLEAELVAGDRIQIGGTTIVFLGEAS